MEQADARQAEMKRLDLQQGRLIELALGSIAKDLVPLVSGAELSEDPLDAAIWVGDDERQKSDAIHGQLAQLRQTLEELGLRALVFIASDQYLSKPRTD